MGLAYMLTPKHAANGYYFDDDRREIIGYAKAWALRIQPEAVNKVQEEMIAYVTEMSSLSPHQQEIVFNMNSNSYWKVSGRRDYPTLYEVVAKQITAMVCSSAASERGWSTFRFIHSRLRNRLSNVRVQKLVFVYTNCLMLDQEDKFDYILDEGAVVTGMDCQEETEEAESTSQL